MVTTARCYRYTLPPLPVASASVDIGYVGVTLALTLGGDLDIVDGAADALIDGVPVDPSVSRARVLLVLREMTRGLMVTALSSYEPRITSPSGLRFEQTRRVVGDTDTMSFTGDCLLGSAYQGGNGDVQVFGECGYRLDVTVAAYDGRELGDGSWFERHDQELAAIGVVILRATPVSPGPLVAVDAKSA